MGEEYLTGGYNTARYGCAAGGTLCGLQIESHLTGVRDTEASRARFAAVLVRAYETFLSRSYGLRLQ